MSSPHRGYKQYNNRNKPNVFSTQIMCQPSINCSTTFCICPDNKVCINGICKRKKKKQPRHSRNKPTSTTIFTLPTDTTTETLPTTIMSGNIPISNGNKATVTYFTDTVFQCISGQPTGNSLAINPLLLGFTEADWTNKFANAENTQIPWCGKQITLTINGKSFTGTIIDTCNPTSGGEFRDPNTGQIIGGKCGYSDVIDLYGDAGLEYLKSINGDDFYQGSLSWEIV